MRRNLRIVLDTNIFISIFLSSSHSLHPVFKALTQRVFTLIVSEFILKELFRVLSEPKLAILPEEEITEFLNTIRKNAIVALPHEIKRLCRDPEDDPIIAAASAGVADFLVTNDKDLLILDKIDRTRIITPKEFIHILNLKSP